MLKAAIDWRRPAWVALGWAFGVLAGLLLAALCDGSARVSSELRPSPGQPGPFRLHGSEEETRAILEALPGLCERGGPAPGDGDVAVWEHNVIVWGQAHTGIRRANRLLPLAKRFTIEALREAGATKGRSHSGSAMVRRHINAVRRVVLDPQLGDAGEVSDVRPAEIRIGPGYAMHLTADDDAVFLLSHELTHVAEWSGKLDGFVEAISERARRAAGVEPRGPQKIDLACDFIAALALKRFIDYRPTGESKAERLIRTLGYQSPSERLKFAWEDFCASYGGYPGDEEHLSQRHMIRALRGLDPKLEALIPADTPPAARP